MRRDLGRPARLLQAPDPLIERGQERRAVARPKGARASGHLGGGTKIRHQAAHGDRHADGVFGEGPSIRRNHGRARLHAATREQHVRGDHDVARTDPSCDPVIGVGSLFYACYQTVVSLPASPTIRSGSGDGIETASIPRTGMEEG